MAGISTPHLTAKPRWGDTVLGDIKSIPVEAWLRSIPRSPQTRGHIRNMLHVLFQCALRWELTDRNPISLVRQSTPRKGIPRVLTPKEFKALLKELTEPYKTMVLLAGCLGLRASELMALQWGDIDWDNLTVFIRRSASGNHMYETKTEQSSKPVPLDPNLAEVLLQHKRTPITKRRRTSCLQENRVGLAGGVYFLRITSNPPRKGQKSERSDGTRLGTRSQL
jgi:integrase